MKQVNTFLIAFGAMLLLLFAQALSARTLEFVLMAFGMLLLFGGFVWLFLHVVLETVGQYKSGQGKIGMLAALLGLFALTAVLSAFYAWTFILAAVLTA